MIRFLLAFLSWLGAFFRFRHDLGLELVALRQQVSVLKRKNPRPRLSLCDRLFWLGLRRWWSQWASVRVIVRPETVVGWHRAGFRRHWRFVSPRRPGRPKISPELRNLIRSMTAENPTWGAPRIHGELLKLGFVISESTVSRYLAQGASPRDSGQRWLTFLKNHREALAAMDFFTVPTATFRVLFVFIMLAHERRRIVHFNITEHPTAQWTAQQIIEAFPWDTAPRYLLRDRDAIYSVAFQQRIKHMGIKEVQIAPRSPWQNPYCERLIGSTRRDVLDHVIVLNERHLQHVLSTYISYYHRFRTHLSLGMDCPHPRAVEPPEIGGVIARPEVGGLHHHYERLAA